MSRQGDVYLSLRWMAKIQKYSFHKSGICRQAFTREYGTPLTLKDRATSTWKRLATPPAGDGKGSRVAWLAFPTNYLSRQRNSVTEGVVWIKGAPVDGATYVELVYTFESEQSVRTSFAKRQERRLLKYIELPGGEALFVAFYHADWDNKDLNVPGEGKVADLVFSPLDPYDTGRPVRICLGPAPAPSDGDALVLRELGGYPVPGTPNPALQGTLAGERP